MKNESGKALHRAFSGRERQADVHDSLFMALVEYKWLKKNWSPFKKYIKN